MVSIDRFWLGFIKLLWAYNDRSARHAYLTQLKSAVLTCKIAQCSSVAYKSYIGILKSIISIYALMRPRCGVYAQHSVQINLSV
jgi:hypothetical protein